MKNLLKHLIVGVILSSIFVVGAYKLFPDSGLELSELLINIPLGTITYTIVKLWTGWLYKRFVFFGRNVVSKYIFDMLVWPIIASGWWVILLVWAANS